MATASPCFRRDLAVETVAEGDLDFVEVRDPAGQPLYRLYAFEHAVAEQLDGRPWPALIESVRSAVGLDLSEQQLEAFARSLGELGLLERERRDADEPATAEPTATGEPSPPAQATADGAESEGDGEPTAVVRDLAQLLASVEAAGHKAAPAAEPDDAVASDAPPREELPVATPSSEDTPLVELAPAAVASLTTNTPPPRASVGTPPPEPDALRRDDARDVPAASGFEPSPASADASTVPVVASPAASPRSVPRTLVWLAVAAAVAAVAYGAWRLANGGARPLSVHTVIPAPASVYRWFDEAGTVAGTGAVELTSSAAGRVADVKPAGARFEAGDVLVLFEGGKRVRAELKHVEERLAYYEQRLQQMRAKHNRPEARQAEIKIAEKQRLIAAAHVELAKHAVLATASGEVVAALVSVGDEVAAGDSVLRIKGQRLQATFDLPAEDARRARALAFCRAELEGHGEVDCEIAGDGVEDGPVAVVLPSQLPVRAGQRVRLARARFDGVFTVPASAVVQVGRSERIFVAAPTGRAEVRAVAVADRGPHDAIVTQGLDVGDAVIVDVPSTLRPNARVSAFALGR